MTTRKKTNEQFLKQVKDLVGEEYVFKEKYVNNKTRLKTIHMVCGNTIYVQPDKFLNAGNRCPICAEKERAKNRTKTTEQYKKEVFQKVGIEHEVIGEYTGVFKRVEMFHIKCGRKYSVTPDGFLNNDVRCLLCTEERYRFERRKTHEEFSKEVSLVDEGEYEVVGKYITAKEETVIKHKVCGKEFSVTPHGFLSGYRCACGKGSKGERAVAKVLDKLNISYERESKFIKRMRFDFKLIDYNAFIEFDGEQHFRPVNGWGGEKAFKSLKRRDEIKNNYCLSKGYELLRIPYWEIENVNEIVTEFVIQLSNESNQINGGTFK